MKKLSQTGEMNEFLRLRLAGWLCAVIVAGLWMRPAEVFAADTFLLEVLVIESRVGKQRAIPEREVSFDIDMETRAVAAQQIILAPFSVGRLGYSRFTLKVDGLRVNSDGEWFYKSIECQEGTLGSLMNVSFCGNYRFGKNNVDDGGMGDDVRVSAPLSFHDFSVTYNARQDDHWWLTLTADSPDTAALFPVYALQFVLRDRISGPAQLAKP